MSKQTATINVELFGRETPVEISFAEVRKVDS
jgi:transcriptional antiterminator NusG